MPAGCSYGFRRSPHHLWLLKSAGIKSAQSPIEASYERVREEKNLDDNNDKRTPLYLRRQSFPNQ